MSLYIFKCFLAHLSMLRVSSWDTVMSVRRVDVCNIQDV